MIAASGAPATIAVIALQASHKVRNAGAANFADAAGARAVISALARQALPSGGFDAAAKSRYLRAAPPAP